jgi:hypothetical protein
MIYLAIGEGFMQLSEHVTIWICLKENISLLYLSVAITDSNLCKMEFAAINCGCLLTTNGIMSTIIKDNMLQVSRAHLAYY